MAGGTPDSGVVRCASCAFGDVRDDPGRGDGIAPEPASRPVVLLTGFGPFPGVARNASADLVTELAAAHPDRFPGFTLAAAVLPVDWTDAPRRLAEVLIATAPAIAVHFGVSSRATGFVIEQHAYNEANDIADDAGRTSAEGPLVARDRARRTATLPARAIARTLARRGYPVELSEDPGRYLCNAVLFHSLKHAAAPRRRAGFVHIPATLAASVAGEASRIGWDEALTGSLHVIETCLEPLRRRGSVLS